MEAQTAARKLSRRRCLQLLGTADRGRLVVVHQVLPVVQPVAYRVDGGDVLAEVDDRFVPPRTVTDTIVAFQADNLGSDPLDGWTVTVVGHAHPTGDTTGHTPGEPDDDHPATRLVRIRIERITGNRVPLQDDHSPTATPDDAGLLAAASGVPV
ncbi:hypothetical protein GCM10010492_58380 [Saccharothrix mutabilis subsp. mutabilis]|uniref:Uncharacterized protein n=1 Tax=Saccharothrix mutabilis subsp. mutabilis TaxID=66855 RepID=A0ABP3E5H1_9PSEU